MGPINKQRRNKLFKSENYFGEVLSFYRFSELHVTNQVKETLLWYTFYV